MILIGHVISGFMTRLIGIIFDNMTYENQILYARHFHTKIQMTIGNHD